MSSRFPARTIRGVSPVNRVPSWIGAARAGARDIIKTLEPPRVPIDADQVTVHYAPPSTPPPTYQRPQGPPSESMVQMPSTLPLPSVLPSEGPPSRRDPSHDAAVKQALGELADALAGTAKARAEFLASTEAQMVELIGLIARRVIGREVSVDRRVIHALVQEGVEALTVQDRLWVRVGSAFEEQVESLQNEFAGFAASVDVQCDPTLEPYACIVQGDLGTVDETVGKRLDRLIQALDAAHVEEG